MYDGHVAKNAPTTEFFEDSGFLVEHGINPPQATMFMDKLKEENIFTGALPVVTEVATKDIEKLLSK